MTSIASPEISPNVAEDSTTTIKLPVVNHGIETKVFFHLHLRIQMLV